MNVESTYLANGSIFSPLPPFPSHVAVLACIVFLISKAKLTNGSLLLLKVIKLREQDHVNLDQNDARRKFRYLITQKNTTVRFSEYLLGRVLQIILDISLAKHNLLFRV